MNQEVITMIILFITAVLAVVIIYNNLSKAKKSGNTCSGNCSGCKIDLSKIEGDKGK